MSWRKAIVQTQDPDGMRVQLLGPEDGWTAWCPVAVPWPGVCWLPSVGSQVAVLLDEQGEAGVVLGALYSDREPPPPGQAAGRVHLEFQDGSSVTFDPEKGLSVASQGGCEVAAIGPVTVSSQDRATVSAPEVILDALEVCRVTASGPVVIDAHGPCTVQSAESVDVTSPVVAVTATESLGLTAPAIALNGPLQVTGVASFSANVSVGGNLAVVGTNPAHHTHPVSGTVAQVVP